MTAYSMVIQTQHDRNIPDFYSNFQQTFWQGDKKSLAENIWGSQGQRRADGRDEEKKICLVELTRMYREF